MTEENITVCKAMKKELDGPGILLQIKQSGNSTSKSADSPTRFDPAVAFFHHFKSCQQVRQIKFKFPSCHDYIAARFLSTDTCIRSSQAHLQKLFIDYKTDNCCRTSKNLMRNGVAQDFVFNWGVALVKNLGLFQMSIFWPIGFLCFTNKGHLNRKNKFSIAFCSAMGHLHYCLGNLFN